MCLPTCPTYERTKQERNSPRGRISLMHAVADGELGIDHAFAEEMSYCLGSLACQTACPAGVNYGLLLETARAEVRFKRLATRTEMVWRAITLASCDLACCGLLDVLCGPTSEVDSTLSCDESGQHASFPEVSAI
jgi:Fe-S oxidoreductase